MSDVPIPSQLTTLEPRDIVVRLRADLTLRDLPIEEPFPPAHLQWKTYASFRHINALAAGHNELWAATWGGVVRWRFADHDNRITFTRFASEHGLPGLRFQYIALDACGHPWVGGSGTGLSTFDGRQWHTFVVDDGLPSEDIQCIINGADGRLWVGTKEGLGYIALDEGTLYWRNQPLDIANLPANGVRALAVDANSTLWLGTDWGLYQLGPGIASRRYTVQDDLPCLQVTQLASDRQGRLWVGTAAGLCLLDQNHIVPCPDLDQPILSLAVEPDGSTLWAVTPNGINVYIPTGIQLVDPHPALGRNAKGRAVAIGKTGRRWLGYTEGVTQQLPERVLASSDNAEQMTRGENALCNCITAIRVDDFGRVWVGTAEGLWFMERGVWRKCQPGIELSSGLVNIQAMDFSLRTKRLWVGGWREDSSTEFIGGGLRQFVGTTEVPLIGESPELPYVDALTCDAQGRVWIAADGVVYCFDGQQWGQMPPLPAEASKEIIQALAIDEDRGLWCGTPSGLWRYDRKWRRAELNVSVQALAHDGKTLWVGTSAGLKRLSGGRRQDWEEMEGLRNANITALMTGQDGTVWVGTTRGLVCIAGNEPRIFTVRQDGLANDAIQALCLDGGTLWIGTANGLSRFSIDSDRKEIS